MVPTEEMLMFKADWLPTAFTYVERTYYVL